jgi:general secretion pathway protein B
LPSTQQPQPGIASSLESAPPTSPYSPISEPAPYDDDAFALPPTYREDYQAPYAGDADRPYPYEDWDSIPPEPDVWVSEDDPLRSPSEPPQDPSIPPDLQRDIEQFKREALGDQYGVTGGQKELPTQTTAPPLPPPPQDSRPNLDVARAANQSSAPVSPSPDQFIREERLPDEVLERLPERTVTVHVYSDDPRKRFVIIASRKLIEGDRTPQGLVVEEIYPNGVVFRYDEHRFFRPR